MFLIIIPINIKIKIPITGIYISGDNTNSVNEGAFKLLSIIFSRPDPRDAAINTCGDIPNRVPKKKFFT